MVKADEDKNPAEASTNKKLFALFVLLAVPVAAIGFLFYKNKTRFCGSDVDERAHPRELRHLASERTSYLGLLHSYLIHLYFVKRNVLRIVLD